MDRNFGDIRNNGRNFGSIRNDGRNFKIDRRNHKRNSRTSKVNEDQRNEVSELWEELNEAFIKGLDLSEDKLEDGEIGRSKSIIEFDSNKLN